MQSLLSSRNFVSTYFFGESIPSLTSERVSFGQTRCPSDSKDLHIGHTMQAHEMLKAGGKQTDGEADGPEGH